VTERLARPEKVGRKLGARQRHTRCASAHAQLLRAESGALPGAAHGDAAQFGNREINRTVAAISRADDAEDSLILIDRQQLAIGGGHSIGTKIESEREDFVEKTAAGPAVAWWKDAERHESLRQR